MDDNNSNNSDEENDDSSKKIDKILLLNKETFYSVLLNIKSHKENIPKLDQEIKGINLVSDITNKQDIDLDENLNINNLVNIN